MAGDITSGMTGFWKLDEGLGVTTADSSVNGNTGTLVNNPLWTTGVLGGALTFDGATTLVDIAGTTVYATQNAPFSFSAWFNLTNFTTAAPVIMTIRTDTGHPWHVLISNLGAYLGLSVGSFGTWVTIKTDLIPSLGDWHHVVATYNGTGTGVIANFQIFLDDVAQPLSAAGGYSNQPNQSRIGDSTGSGNQWTGQIDDVRLYNRILGAADIARLYGLPQACQP